MNTAWLCVAVLGCFVITTDAAVTAWTEPVISTIDGTGTVATPLADNAATFPQLAAVGATVYAITSQIPAGYFAIPAGDGLLALIAGKQLNYETVKQHVLVVTASDGAGSTGTATITINISDVNDNPPAFSMSTYSACVVDKANAGATVLTVSTTDADGTTGVNVISAMTITDHNSNTAAPIPSLRTFIPKAGNTGSDFEIATNGVITLAKVANMATTPKYTLTVRATDSDTPPLAATATVSVTVAEMCGSGVGLLAASLLTLLAGLVTSLSVL